MFEIVPFRRELLKCSAIFCDISDKHTNNAAAFMYNGEVHGVVAMAVIDERLTVSAVLSNELRKHPQVFHRTAVQTLKVLHETYEKIYAPGKAISEEWMLRLGFTPCTDENDLFGESEGYVKCLKQQQSLQ